MVLPAWCYDGVVSFVMALVAKGPADRGSCVFLLSVLSHLNHSSSLRQQQLSGTFFLCKPVIFAEVSEHGCV